MYQKRVVINFFNRSTTAFLEHYGIPVQGIRSRTGDENSIIRRTNTRNNSTFGIFKYTNDHQRMITNKNRFPHNIPFGNWKQSPFCAITDHTCIPVTIHRIEPAAFDNDGTGFGKKVRSYTKQ